LTPCTLWSSAAGSSRHLQSMRRFQTRRRSSAGWRSPARRQYKRPSRKAGRSAHSGEGVAGGRRRPVGAPPRPWLASLARRFDWRVGWCEHARAPDLGESNPSLGSQGVTTSHRSGDASRPMSRRQQHLFHSVYTAGRAVPAGFSASSASVEARRPERAVRSLRSTSGRSEEPRRLTTLAPRIQTFASGAAQGRR
jgi:hypothetical protein